MLFLFPYRNSRNSFQWATPMQRKFTNLFKTYNVLLYLLRFISGYIQIHALIWNYIIVGFDTVIRRKEQLLQLRLSAITKNLFL